ncbi:beta-casein isoform 2 precursor [Daubentonia madagascariensis]|uniref:Beta-casein n=1 Tax=Daubentonia madagascariensis TaxID=31869 RepID=A0ABD2ENR0_DAUMA
MKVLILACLVALALAKESVESLSRSEESVTHEKKIEKVNHEEQQQREDERQDKFYPFIQQQPLVYPFAEAIPYTILPQNILPPLVQPAVVPPFLQPEIMEVSKAKETVFPKNKVMSFLTTPAMSFFGLQNPNLKNQPLSLSLLRSLTHQAPQPIPQTPVLPPQPMWSHPQPKALSIPQQVVPYPQRDMPVQALLLYQDILLNPTRQFYPVTQQPLAPVHNPVIV